MNPTNAGATLSESIQNFQKVDFLFKTDDGMVFSSTLLQPSREAHIIASASFYSGENQHIFIKSKTFHVKDKKVETWQHDDTLYYTGQVDLNTMKIAYGDYIAIVKVIGWKKL